MINNVFKSIFAMAMVVASALGFVSCEEKGDDVVANPTVALSTSSLNFTNEESSKSVDIEANSDWMVETPDVDWVTVTPTAGNGNKTITVAVSMNDSGAVRSTVIKVCSLHKEYGKWETKKLNVSQSADNNATVDEVLLYGDNFDGEEATKTYGSGSSWPYIDQFPQFANAEGPGAVNVTYSGSGVSVRANSTSNSTYSDYEGSGSNNIFFGASAYFQVNNITLNAESKSYKLTFGSEKYTQDGDSVFKNDEFHVYLSKNGNGWEEIEYTFAGTEGGRWNVATAEFTLTEVPESLFIKFSADVASVYRLDDVNLFTGNGGQQVTLPEGGDVPTPPTPGDITSIADVLALGQGAKINAVIEGIVISNMELNNLTSKKGMYVQDETGALQFYLASNHEFAFGTKVQIDLTGATLGAYNGAVQVSGLALEKVTAISTDNTVQPKSVSMADFLANKYEGQYIALEGVQVVESELNSTWVVGDAHTSINMEDANGNNFVVFSSKYSTYGGEKVAQGAGTIKGISSVNNGKMQIIFAQASDYAGLSGARFEGSDAPAPGPEPTPGEVVKVTVKEFLDAPENEVVYELTGEISAVDNTTYGNFYIKDATGEVYIYGLCSPAGEQKYWEASGVKLGDTITIHTVRTSYNGVPQGKNAIYVSHIPCDVEEEVVPENCTKATIVFSELGLANGESVNGRTFNVDSNVSLVFNQGGANNEPAYYNSGMAIRMYQNGATLDVSANGKKIKSIEFTFANNHYYLGANVGSLSEEATVRTWTGDATAVQFTSTGTDKDHRAYVAKLSVIYEK